MYIILYSADAVMLAVDPIRIIDRARVVDTCANVESIKQNEADDQSGCCYYSWRGDFTSELCARMEWEAPSRDREQNERVEIVSLIVYIRVLGTGAYTRGAL